MFRSLLLFVLFFAAGPGLSAQDSSQTAANLAGAPSAKNSPAQPGSSSGVHRFWDSENIGFFTGVVGARLLDYASTRHLRNQGNNEWLLTNAIVDNRPLFVGIELAGSAASVGVSYLFHRAGHHSLERWTSIVHIGVGTGGSIRNYLLKPPQPISYQPANLSAIAFQPEK